MEYVLLTLQLNRLFAEVLIYIKYKQICLLENKKIVS